MSFERLREDSPILVPSTIKNVCADTKDRCAKVLELKEGDINIRAKLPDYLREAAEIICGVVYNVDPDHTIIASTALCLHTESPKLPKDIDIISTKESAQTLFEKLKLLQVLGVIKDLELGEVEMLGLNSKVSGKVKTTKKGEVFYVEFEVFGEEKLTGITRLRDIKRTIFQYPIGESGSFMNVVGLCGLKDLYLLNLLLELPNNNMGNYRGLVGKEKCAFRFDNLEYLGIESVPEMIRELIGMRNKFKVSLNGDDVRDQKLYSDIGKTINNLIVLYSEFLKIIEMSKGFSKMGIKIEETEEVRECLSEGGFLQFAEEMTAFKKYLGDIARKGKNNISDSEKEDIRYSLIMFKHFKANLYANMGLGDFKYFFEVFSIEQSFIPHIETLI